MIDPNWFPIIQTISNSVGLIVLAWISYKTAKLGKTMTLLEKNTNSIKDALVKSVGEAEFAKGVRHGEDNPIKHD